MIQAGDVINMNGRHYEIVKVYGFSAIGLHLNVKRITSSYDDPETVTTGISYDYCIPKENLNSENHKNCIIEIGTERVGQKVFADNEHYAYND